VQALAPSRLQERFKRPASNLVSAIIRRSDGRWRSLRKMRGTISTSLERLAPGSPRF
jgi:hypothetical protein